MYINDINNINKHVNQKNFPVRSAFKTFFIILNIYIIHTSILSKRVHCQYKRLCSKVKQIHSLSFFFLASSHILLEFLQDDTRF